MKSTISGPLQTTKPVPNKKTTIINLSDEKLTTDETSLLSLGLKFTPTPKNDPTTDIATHIQPAVKHLPDGIQSSIAHDVTHLLHSPPTGKSKLQSHLHLALKNLQPKTQRLKILPADKGNSIVILTHKQYHDKVQHIDEGPYTELSKDPTSTLPSKLDRLLKRLLTDNKITKSFYDSCRIRNLHPRSPQLYGTPKIHKVNCPIRPIVSFYNTPLIALHKTLAQNSGGPMGAPLTVELAEIRVTELETIALNTSPQPPSLYKHFVDDGFGVFRDKTHAEVYLEYVNSLSSDLVYTIEHPSQDGSIPFLDILIHKDLSTSVYRKPTHTYTYTHYSTAAPQTTKDSLIRSLTRRAYNICSPQHLDLELTHVKSVLLDNGYPLNHINLIMHRTKKSLSKPKPPRTKAYSHNRES